MTDRLVIALDGHDGAGKTTLAAALANCLGGTAVRPFSGATGAELLHAGKLGNVPELVRIGGAAIEKAIASVPGGGPVVLDRGWMTVASFVPESADFFLQWDMWIPTTLCWSDLATTLSRLTMRHDEDAETLEWHNHYLAVYLDLAQRSGSMVLRTDLFDFAACIDQLVTWAMARPAMPAFNRHPD